MHRLLYKLWLNAFVYDSYDFWVGFVIKFRVIPDICLAQHEFDEHGATAFKWCVTSDEEMWKCKNFTNALVRDRALFDDDLLDLQCVKGYDTDECIKMIDGEKAHIMSLDAGEVFIAGRYFSLIPIMQETLEGGLSNYYAVAVVKANTLPDVHQLSDLRNKKACFPYVGSQAGWNIPIYTVSSINLKCCISIDALFFS